MTLLCAAALAACGSEDPKLSVEASTPADERLAEAVQAELRVYDESFDLESMPQAQQDQLADVVDNLPQAAGGIEVLRVSDGVVEAETDFPDDDQGAVTGRLICGAIERAAGESGAAPGSRALGEDDSVLADCDPEDSNFP
jgi:hypothetical protein